MKGRLEWLPLKTFTSLYGQGFKIATHSSNFAVLQALHRPNSYNLIRLVRLPRSLILLGKIINEFIWPKCSPIMLDGRADNHYIYCIYAITVTMIMTSPSLLTFDVDEWARTTPKSTQHGSYARGTRMPWLHSWWNMHYLVACGQKFSAKIKVKNQPKAAATCYLSY